MKGGGVSTFGLGDRNIAPKGVRGGFNWSGDKSNDSSWDYCYIKANPKQ